MDADSSTNCGGGSTSAAIKFATVAQLAPTAIRKGDTAQKPCIVQYATRDITIKKFVNFGKLSHMDSSIGRFIYLER